MNGKMPERLPGGGILCPKCRKPLQFIEASSEYACANCGFRQPIKKV